MQNAIIANTLKPAYMIPKNKMPQVEKQINNCKNLWEKLPPVEKIDNKRKFNIKWDEIF